jgi:hypothetical protein
MTKVSRSIGLLVLLLIASAALAQQKTFLPQEFSGWTKDASPSTGTNPSAVDAASSKVLAEYGFTNFEVATYSRPDRKLTVKAAQFQDASGAYGAFTFYRSPGMLTEKIGTMGASANERILFFRDNVLVQAQFDRVTAMSAGELREFAASLPAAKGNAANLPSLPGYFPRDQVEQNSAKYVIGPAALNAIGSPINSELVDFSSNAEVITGKHTTGGSDADVILISYPTPQIAGDRLKAIQAAATQNADTTFVAKRTGPIVALVSGHIAQSDAKAILSRVSYEADVTWNENTGLSKHDNIGSIVVAACILAGIIFLASVGTGAVFGFARIFLERAFPSRYKPRGEGHDFIRLDL